MTSGHTIQEGAFEEDPDPVRIRASQVEMESDGVIKCNERTTGGLSSSTETEEVVPIEGVSVATSISSNFDKTAIEASRGELGNNESSSEKGIMKGEGFFKRNSSSNSRTEKARKGSVVDPLDKDFSEEMEHCSLNSVKETNSYVLGVDQEEDKIILNNTQRKAPKVFRRRSTRDSIRQAPFHSGKHARIIPMDSGSSESRSTANSIVSMHREGQAGSTLSVATGNRENLQGGSVSQNEQLRASANSLALVKIPNDGALKRSESAALEIQKMRKLLLQKREMRRKQKKFLDDDKVLVGNKVTEGHVNFIIAYNMLTGIRVAVSRCSGIMKPLTEKDFKFSKKLAFDYHGNELTPSSQYAFKFKDYCPEVFRELRALFGLDPADYLMSLTSKYILSELNSPGKSGSFFYFSRDYKYIIKTIHHSEHRHLRRILFRYYKHVKENPDTLISQYYGLHRIKMPISFRNKIKHRKIYFVVMNNLFPPHLQIHTTYDLKGSTWGRYAQCNKVDDPQNTPVLKDLNWLEQKESIKFGPLKAKKFLLQLEKDAALLSELNIMDYSLLLGVHNMEKGNDLIEDDKDDGLTDNLCLAAQLAPSQTSKHNIQQQHNPHHHLPRRSTHQSISHSINTTRVVQHFFQQDEGGIRASDQLNHDLNQIYFVGIIDCLTNYSFFKKLETLWRSMNHDLKEFSAIPPKLYRDRFYQFIEDSVNKHYYEDNPLSTGYHD